MASSTVYTCDRCGERTTAEPMTIPDGWTNVDVRVAGAQRAGSLDVDLCPRCGPAVRAAIKKSMRKPIAEPA